MAFALKTMANSRIAAGVAPRWRACAETAHDFFTYRALRHHMSDARRSRIPNNLASQPGPLDAPPEPARTDVSVNSPEEEHVDHS
jgi:hypothetical protein